MAECDLPLLICSRKQTRWRLLDGIPNRCPECRRYDFVLVQGSDPLSQWSADREFQLAKKRGGNG